VLESFAEQSHNSIAFTDRQAKLATDLVTKYERQLFKLGVDLTPVKTEAKFRLPLREIDRTSRVWVENDTINLKFPYLVNIIDALKAEAKSSRGSIKWQHNKKYWAADLTEYNTNWCYTFAQQNNFEIDSTLKHTMDLLLATEKNPYKIELCANADLQPRGVHGEHTESVGGVYDISNKIRIGRTEWDLINTMW
jgi:hypothetical protein